MGTLFYMSPEQVRAQKDATGDKHLQYRCHSFQDADWACSTQHRNRERVRIDAGKSNPNFRQFDWKTPKCHLPRGNCTQSHRQGSGCTMAIRAHGVRSRAARRSRMGRTSERAFPLPPKTATSALSPGAASSPLVPARGPVPQSPERIGGWLLVFAILLTLGGDISMIYASETKTTY